MPRRISRALIKIGRQAGKRTTKKIKEPFKPFERAKKAFRKKPKTVWDTQPYTKKPKKPLLSKRQKKIALHAGIHIGTSAAAYSAGTVAGFKAAKYRPQDAAILKGMEEWMRHKKEKI